jgi:methyltransferase-like protein
MEVGGLIIPCEILLNIAKYDREVYVVLALTTKEAYQFLNNEDLFKNTFDIKSGADMIATTKCIKAILESYAETYRCVARLDYKIVKQEKEKILLKIYTWKNLSNVVQYNLSVANTLNIHIALYLKKLNNK